MPSAVDQGSPGQPYQPLYREKTVAAKSMVVSRLQLSPPNCWGSTKASPAEDLKIYDFWDPKQQQIPSASNIFVGYPYYNTTPGALDPGDYTMSYTNAPYDPDRGDTMPSDWYPSIAAAGGPSKVSGVRVALTKTFAAGNPDSLDAVLIVAIPLELNAPDDGVVADTGYWSFTDATGEDRADTWHDHVFQAQHRLAVVKKASTASIVSGAKVTYTLSPSVLRPFGAVEDTDVDEIEVVDELPPGIIDVDPSKVTAPWTVTRSGSLIDGMTLRFAHDGKVRTESTLPEITYTITSSTLKPESEILVNTVVIDAAGTHQEEVTRTSQAIVTVRQAEVVSEEKRVVGPNLIEVGDRDVAWETRWFNYQTNSQGKSHFVDVLPFEDDGRGTKFAGAATLIEASLTNGQGKPAAVGYGSIEYTTDDPRSVQAV